MNIMNQLIPPASLFYWQAPTNGPGNDSERSRHKDYGIALTKSTESREDINWWDSQMIKWNGKLVLSMEHDLTMQ